MFVVQDLVRAVCSDEGGQCLDTAEMLAGLLGVGRHAHAIALLQGEAQLQGVDGVQPETVYKQRVASVDVMGSDVFQRQGRNDEFFDLLFKLKHVKVP